MQIAQILQVKLKEGVEQKINQYLNNQLKLPHQFVCPLTKKAFKDPVKGEDGVTYERTAIQDQLREKQQLMGSQKQTLFPKDNLVADVDIKDAIEAFRNNEMKVYFMERFDYLIKLLDNSMDKINYNALIRKLSDQLSEISRDNDNIFDNQMRQINKRLLNAENNDLFAIFYSNISCHEKDVQRPKEDGLLNLFVNYLHLKTSGKNGFGRLELFTLSEDQRQKFIKILESLDLWRQQIVILNKSNFENREAKIQELKTYCESFVTKLRESGKPGDMFIIPSGFKLAHFSREYGLKHFTLEKTFTGEYATTSIIEKTYDPDFLNFYQIDPKNPYSYSYCQINENKVNIHQTIKRVPQENFTPYFLEQLLTLRFIQPEKPYIWEDLYEVVLPKLEGYGKLSESDFITLEEKGYYGLSWALVKQVFAFFLIREFKNNNDTWQLYHKILVEFEFQVLANYDLESISDYTQTKFLLNEMCAKVSIDVEVIENKESYNINALIEKVDYINQWIKKTNKHFNMIKIQQNIINTMEFKINDFSEYGLNELSRLQFIKQKIALNTKLEMKSMITKQFHTFNFDYQQDHFEQLKKMNKALTKFDYRGTNKLNRILQLQVIVEDFVFKIVQENSGFKNWYKSSTDKKALEKSCAQIADLAFLYYNCCMFIQSQLRSKDYLYQDPALYSKLILIEYSLFAILEEVVRTDKILGNSLENYSISTSLNEDCKLSEVLKSLVLPSKKWFLLVKALNDYFQKDFQNCSKMSSYMSLKEKTTNLSLFHYTQVDINNSSDTKNVDVKFLLGLYKIHYRKSYKAFEKYYKKTADSYMKEKWHGIFSDSFMPKMLTNLLQISFWARGSLAGYIQIEGENKISKYKYCLRPNSTSSDIISKTVKFDSKIDFMKLTNYQINSNKKASLPYQNIITPFEDKKRNESETKLENQVISQQGDKPSNLILPQYYRLALTMLFENLKLIHIYAGLKNEEITLDAEEQCLVIKQALFKLNDFNEQPQLQWLMDNELMQDSIVMNFMQLLNDSKEKYTQTKVIGHLIDIAVFIFDFCNGQNQKKLYQSLLSLRESLTKILFDNIRNQMEDKLKLFVAKLSAIVILLYQLEPELTLQDIEIIVQLRTQIDISSKLQLSIPLDDYLKVMTFLFQKQQSIMKTIQSNLEILNSCTKGIIQNKQNTQWSYNKQLNIFEMDQYSIVPIKGQLYVNGQPFCGLPPKILGIPIFQECFGTANFLVKSNTIVIDGQNLLQYNSIGKKDQIRVTYINAELVWIEVQKPNEQDFKTFISQSLLDKLPKFLLDEYLNNGEKKKYTHWYSDEIIYIKDSEDNVKYLIDLQTFEILSEQHKKEIIPFKEDFRYDNNDLFKVLKRFEDPDHIITLKENRSDHRPSLIILERFNLTFQVCYSRIISLDYKGYCLSQSQYINTLNGFSNYLILDEINSSDISVHLKQVVIIPYHPLIQSKGIDTQFYNNQVDMDIKEVYKPSYFSYTVDKNLKCLNTETISGTLFLALLYLKSASLDIDPLYQMNGYEVANELLSQCWQNYEYTDEELDIILQFFDYKRSNQTEEINIKDIFQNIIDGNYAKHRNVLTIYLKLFYLLSCSQQVQFMKAFKNATLKFGIQQEDIMGYTLNFYLLNKPNICLRCQLSLNEEKKILEFLGEKQKQEYERVNHYKEIIIDNQSITFKTHNNKCYQNVQNSIFSKESNIITDFHLPFKQMIDNKYYDPNQSLVNQELIVSNGIYDWVNKDFDIQYFLSLYMIALNIQKDDSTFTYESFSYLLSKLYHRLNQNKEAANKKLSSLLIQILNTVALKPQNFKEPPNFAFLKEHQINSEEKFCFSSKYLKFSYGQFPCLNVQFNEKQQHFKNFIDHFKLHLDEKNSVIDNLITLQGDIFKNKVKEFVSQQVKAMNIEIKKPKKTVKEIIESFVNQRRNKQFYDFLIEIGEICNATKFQLQYRPEQHTISEVLLIQYRVPNNQENLEEFKVKKTEKLHPQWNTKLFNIDEYHAMVSTYFEVITKEPEKLGFALNMNLMPESEAKEVFKENYGKDFANELLLSFDSKMSQNIALIDGQAFMIQEGTSVKQVIKNTFNLNYNEEMINLEKKYHDFLNEITPLIKDWINQEQENLYLTQEQKDEIKELTDQLKQNFDDLSQEIHSFLQSNNVIVQNQQLNFVELQEQLKQLKKNMRMKKIAIEYQNRIDNLEMEQDEFIVQRDYLFEKYFSYIRTNKSIPLHIMKLICSIKNIKYIIYNSISSDTIEFKYDKQNSNASKKKNVLRFVYKHPYLHKVLEEVKDERLIISSKKPQTIGYLQTKNTIYNLKEGQSINQIKTFLNYNYKSLLKSTKQLWNQIKMNIQNLDNGTLKSQMFRVNIISGKKVLPSKRQVLKIITDTKQLKNYNPFIKKQGFKERIMAYLQQETLIQQIERVIQQIYTLQTLDQSDKEELQSIYQQVFSNTLTKRTYNSDDFPEWLLFEMENNILIRGIQSTLIQTMIKDKENCFYQLNMGEGKTSVILILLAQMLANGNNIVRINCLEPLMGVMVDLIKNKFNGFFQKKVFIMPFQRNIDLQEKNLNLLFQMLQECKEGRHIIIMTPEQRLCFQLKKQEMFLDYLQLKDADGIFDWRKHFKMCENNFHENMELDFNAGKQGTKTNFKLTDEQEKLKNVLVALGYLNYKDYILKYPLSNKFDSEEIKEFEENVSKQLMQLYNLSDRKSMILNAYEVLRFSSPLNKKLIEERISILEKIDGFKFFDILDESDEILRHGKELNYTLGQFRPLDGGKIRWEIPFIIFRTLFNDWELINLFKESSRQKDCAVIFQEDFRPRGNIGGGIPMLRFIDKDFYQEKIKTMLAKKLGNKLRESFGEIREDIIDDNGENYGSYVNFINCTSKVEDTIIKFLKNRSIDMMNSFILTKAWLSHELLFHVMSYRYRVEYGLSDKEDKLIAIPFKGKDLPSEKSEFSHPDIMIGFTIMSYLYKGLTQKQITECLVSLKNDLNLDRDSLLRKWLKTSKKWIIACTMKEGNEYPHWMESFKTLDIDNEEKLNLVHKYLSRNQGIIEYYLGKFIFPQDARHFERKLTGNAHSLAGEGQCNGFSGTDDKNVTMPESIVPKRLPSQESTNGKMIHILSRKINNKFQTKFFMTSQEFLKSVCDEAKHNNNCYILIDAGAVITEMNNLDVANFLIQKMPPKFDGIVYLDDKKNKLRVILRNQDIIPLSTCHIDKKRLFVYLDEVHTRGVDIKLPLTAQGIVTLGKGMNKDKLMQSAMRLRELDQNQSVVFWGSEQIAAEIAKITGVNNTHITSIQVIIWVTYNTILKNQKDLYAVTLEKLHYVIKRRAEEYQKMINTIPLTSLIKEFETYILDSIELIYGKSPLPLKPNSELNIKMHRILQRFYIRIIQELEQVASTHQNKAFIKEIAKQIEKNEENEDCPKMESILKSVSDKLPSKVYLSSNNNFDDDQENEREVEEMSHDVIIQAKKIPPQQEKQWDFSLIFEQDFIDKGCMERVGSPHLRELKRCFDEVDIPGIKGLEWHHSVFATQNFISTVEGINPNKGIFQNDYLKPGNFVLIHKKTQNPYFILITCYEASYLSALLLSQSNIEDVCIIHIDDKLGGPTMVPRTFQGLTCDQYNEAIVVLRLFNGNSKFSRKLLPFLYKAIGYIEETAFHIDPAVSRIIYKDLNHRNYIQNGFITMKLAKLLKRKTDRINHDLENRYGLELTKFFNGVVMDSIADLGNIYQLNVILKELIKTRGKMNLYSSSTLYTLFEKKL